MSTMSALLPWVGLLGPVVLALAYSIYATTSDDQGVIINERRVRPTEDQPEFLATQIDVGLVKAQFREPKIERNTTKITSRKSPSLKWKAVTTHIRGRIAMSSDRARTIEPNMPTGSQLKL